MNAGVETLDLRPLPAAERHKKIFQKWEALQPGEAFCADLCGVLCGVALDEDVSPEA